MQQRDFSDLTEEFGMDLDEGSAPVLLKDIMESDAMRNRGKFATSLVQPQNEAKLRK